MQITFNSSPNRPLLIFDAGKFPEVTVKPEDVRHEAQTYMLTPVGRKLVQLIVELVPFTTLGQIIVRAVEKSIVVDSGIDAGEPLDIRVYALLLHIIANLDNLADDAFVNMQAKEILFFVDEQAHSAGVRDDSTWWRQDQAGMAWWDATNQGSVPS